LKFFGYMGAAYGEVAAILPMYIVFYLVLRKTIHVSFRNVLRHVWLAYVEVYMIIKKFFKKA
jgi:hypothetical protein